MKRTTAWFNRGIRALLVVALTLGMMPLGAVSAAPIVDRQVGSDRVETVPVAVPPAAPSAVNITATKRDALANDVDSDSRADPGDTLRYTVVITNSGDTDATGVVFNDTIDNNTVVSGTVKSTPLARNDAYNAVGNVRISLAAGNGVLANDNDPDGSAISVVISPTASTNGGNVAMNANGSFTYNPPPGFEGTDTFSYTLQDTDGNQDLATVSVTVSGMIWFINAAAPAGGDGRLTTPFNCLSGAGCFSTAADDPGDNIFVYENAAAYSGGITLLNNQKLIGQDATSSLATLAGVTPPSYSDALPSMNPGAPATTINGGTNAVALAQSNALYGFTAGTATGASISGSSFGTLAVNEVVINTTGAGLGLSTGTFGSPAAFTSITSSGGANNVSLLGVTGTANLGSGALSGASSHAFTVDGGTAVLTYAGTINNSTARSVSVINKTGGSVTFSGAIAGTAQGVFLNNNTGATITFMGGLALNTGANAAFTATGGGTVNVCDENPCNPAATGALVNTLATSIGTALNVANTTIGANNLEFRSISANGATKGIILNATGTSGGLKVNGTGTTDGSGGTIQNISTRGAEFINTSNLSLKNMIFTNACTVDFPTAPTGLSLGNNTADNAVIHLQNVSGAALDNVDIIGSAEQGINGHNVSNFSYNNSTMLNVGNGADEDGIHFYNMVGTSTINNTTITSSGDDNVNIQNNNNLPADPPQSTTGTITINGGSANTSVLGSGHLFGIRGTMNTTIVLNNATSSNNFSGGIVADAFDTATMNLTVSNSTSSGNNDQLSVSAGDNSIVKLTVNGNTLSSVAAGDFVALSLTGSAFDTGFTFDAIVTNNTINIANNLAADAIFVDNAGGGIMNVAITNNTINYAGTQRSLLVQAGQDGNGQNNMTVTGNSIDIKLDGTGNTNVGFLVQNSITGPGNTSSLCADIGGAGALQNTFTHSLGGSLAAGDIRVRQRNDGTVRLPGYGGGATDTAAVISYLNGRNVEVSTSTATADSSGFAGGGACTQPVVMLSNGNFAQSQLESSPSANASGAQIFAAALSTKNVGSSSKALFSPAFDPAFAPQADRAVAIDRVNAPITPLNIGTLPAGKTITLTFEVVINNPVPPGVTQVSNQGNITADGGINILTDDPDTGTANDPTVTPLDIEVDLQLTKSVDPVTAYPGLPITYTITYQNAGPQASTNVVISDPLPSALTGVAYQSSATITPTGSYMWTIGTLLTGEGGTITVTGLISSALAVPTTITNTATITGTGRDTDVGNNTASVGLPIADLPISGLLASNDSPTQLGSGTNFTATVSAGTSVVHQWNFGDGATSSGATPAHTYATIGTYTAMVTATNSTNSQVATTTVSVVDVPISGLSATTDGPTRLNNATNFSVTLNAGSNVVYTWDFGDGAAGSGTTPAHTYAALGTYTATVTATNSVNQQVATTVVSVIDQPITGLSATNDSPTQLGSATIFTAALSGGTNVTYQWNFGDGALGGGANATHTYGAVGPYVATVTATNGVSVVVATTNVSIVDVPISGLSAANNSPTIFGNATAFTATIGGGTNATYHWNFGDGLLGSGATASHTYGAIGTYTATVTATNGSNTQVATTVAVIFDTPITGLSATNDSPTRLGNATNFAATTTGGSGINYVWNFGDGATGSGAQPSHTYAGLGTYTATVTATNTLNTQTADTVVVVIDQPILGLSPANDSPTRLGSVTNFTATISNGTNVTYQWNFGDNAMGSGANAAHTYGAVGAYVATVTATNGVSVAVATTNVSIIDTPIVNLAATNDSPTRLGSVTNFTATIDGGSNVTYQWNFGDGSLSSGATAAHTYSAIGAYVATVTATNGVSVVVATTNVSIIDRAIVGLSATNSSPTGLGNSTVFTATISDGTNVVYAWNFGDGSLGSGATSSHTYAAVGTYTATVTATNGVSIVVASTVATIVNQPVSGLSATNDSPTRLGSITTLTATITTGSNVTYQWDFGDSATGSGANATHAYAAIGTYTATVTATNSINSQTSSTIVVVIDLAIVGLDAANDSPTRLGSTTAFTATISDGSNVMYVWNFGDGATDSGATSSHTYAAVGAYVATVTATNGVSVVVATTNVSIIDTPVVNLAAANSGPTGLNLSTFLTATIDSGSNVGYQWNFGDGNIGTGATTSHIYPALGLYTATVTATNGVSNVVAATLVTIVDQPLSNLSATSSSPTLLGNTSFFTATVNGTSAIYAWDFGDGQTASGAHPSHVYTATGLYTAIVTATNSTGSLTTTTKVNVFSGRTYLPLIMRNYVAAPDLVVTSLKAGTGNVQVVIKNQGDQAVTDGFYVDVYINPNPAPTAVNQIWSDGRSAQGLTWGVTSSLQPGQVLTLTIGDAYYLADFSVFTGTLPVGTPLYAQVDSYDAATTYGAVHENHEIVGAPYNNILGPVLSTTILAPLNTERASEKGNYWLPIRWQVQ